MTPHHVVELISQVEAGKVSRRDFVVRAAGLGLSWSAIGLLLASCRRQGDGGSPGDSVAAGGPPLEEVGTELSIYNWSDYIAEDTVPNFEKEFGIKVTYATYESNEELVAQLRSGASDYDLAVPSGYIIPALTASGLLAPLSRQYLTNWNNLSPIFLDLASDPESRYSVPWQWGTTGIAYRTDRIATPPDSWAVFHDRDLRLKMTMMDEAREVIGAFLRYRGHSLNSVIPAELAQARADVLQARPNLKGFKSAPVKVDLVAGDVWVAQLWNGDTTQARVQQPNLAYVLPKEGCTIWSDSLVVPRSARHKRAAHEFMNYILRPEVAAGISNFTGYGSPNARAELKVPVPYPSPEELSRLEYQTDLGENRRLWDEIWSQVD